MTQTQTQTVQEAASSESTSTEVLKLFHVSLEQLDTGKFDVTELGEAYEGIGKDLPLVGQYVEARRKLFAEADKRGFGRGLRVLYHAGEAGARVTATLTAQAAQLAASNYGAAGAAGAATASTASLMALSATPIGLGLALVTAFLTFAFTKRYPTPAEAVAMAQQFHEQRATARKILDLLNDGKHSLERFTAEKTGLYQRLEDLAQIGADPTAFLANNPRLRDWYRESLARNGVDLSAIASDAQLAAETKKRAARIQAEWEEGLRRGKAGSIQKRLPITKALPSKAQKVLAALRRNEIQKVTVQKRLPITKALPSKAQKALAALRRNEIQKAARVHAIEKSNKSIAALRNDAPVVPRAQMITQPEGRSDNGLLKVGIVLGVGLLAYKLLR